MSLSVWDNVVHELNERREEGFLGLRKDLFCLFYKENKDIQKSCEMANIATAWLAKEPNLEGYDQVGE